MYKRQPYNICFLCSTHAANTHKASVSASTMANPAVVLANGIPSDWTFMPLSLIHIYNDFWLQSPSLKGTWHSPYGYWYLQYGYVEE